MTSQESYYDMADEANKREWIVKVTDYGSYLSKHDSNKSVRIATLKKIVKAMGGRLKVESNSEETSFMYRFPCSILN